MLSTIERYAPTLAMAIAALIAWFKLASYSVWLLSIDQNISNAFGPVFDLATFSAASIFTIYVLALSRAEGFLGKILNTKTFFLFHGYVANAISLNIGLFLWTAGYMVMGMGDLSHSSVLIIASAWVGLTVGAFISVSRVVVIFLIIVGDRSKRLREKPASQTS